MFDKILNIPLAIVDFSCVFVILFKITSRSLRFVYEIKYIFKLKDISIYYHRVVFITNIQSIRASTKDLNIISPNYATFFEKL